MNKREFLTTQFHFASLPAGRNQPQLGEIMINENWQKDVEANTKKEYEILEKKELDHQKAISVAHKMLGQLIDELDGKGYVVEHFGIKDQQEDFGLKLLYADSSFSGMMTVDRTLRSWGVDEKGKEFTGIGDGHLNFGFDEAKCQRQIDGFLEVVRGNAPRHGGLMKRI